MSIEYATLTFERLGHASVRIETEDETVIYVDPWSDVLDGSPGDGDVVFVTHDDFDHYDPNAIEAVATPNAAVAAYEAIDVSDLGLDVLALPESGELTVDGIAVQTMPAYNDPDGEHVWDEGKPFHPQGEGIGFLLTIDGTTILIPSDSDFLDHHRDLTAEVFIPPIGGHYTMDRHEAADFARSIDPELVLPVHYNTLEEIQTDETAFATELEADGIRVELF